MQLPRRFLFYFFLFVVIFTLQLSGFFTPLEVPVRGGASRPFSERAELLPTGFKSETTPQKSRSLEISEETFAGKGGPQELSLKLSLLLYEVQPGDNLWEIAKREKLDLDTLISANKLKRANLINAGDILHIPNQKGVFHKVKKGETLSKIAQAYKIAVEEILEINGIENPNILTVDKRVFIPGGKLLTEEREYILGWGFIRPCRGWISSRYGWRRDPFTKRRCFHRGVDFAAPRGTPIYAARDGRITRSGWAGGYGRMIAIKHSCGYSTRYGHNSVNLVKKGQRVRQGQLIARVGNTGRSTGSHLHFEIRRWGRSLNPLSLVRRYARRK